MFKRLFLLRGIKGLSKYDVIIDLSSYDLTRKISIDSVAQFVARLTPDQKAACSNHVGVS